MRELSQHLDNDFPLTVSFGYGRLTSIQRGIYGRREAVNGRLECGHIERQVDCECRIILHPSIDGVEKRQKLSDRQLGKRKRCLNCLQHRSSNLRAYTRG